MRSIIIGSFPYSPDSNPYQRLFTESLERAGVAVDRIPPRKWFPLRHAASRPVDLLQLDWPHDWYQGRSPLSRFVKRAMYRDGLRQLRSRPVVWTAHNLVAHDAADAADELGMIQALIEVCDGIIVLSEAAGRLLRETHAVPASTRVEVIHHGHYIDCYPNVVDRADARARLGIATQSRALLCLGRLQPYKGLEDLIDAFVRVASRGDTLLLAGRAVSPAYAAELRTAVEGANRHGLRVELHDRMVPDEELQIYFNACDVVALPFRQVLNSGSLLLAMSFGCPVVAPRLGSIPEVVCPEGWFAYDADESSGLSGALVKALAARDLTNLRSRILSFTERRYGWDSVGIKARELYGKILDSRSSSQLAEVRS